MPKLDIDALPEINRTGYPPPFDEIVRGRFRKALGDAGGLTQFGVNLTRLEPGSASAQRHWHEKEDEFVFIVAGEVVLVEDEGEMALKAGDAAAFKAGVADGHHLVNRSDRDVLYLEVGTRDPNERGEYSDIDMKFISENNATRYTRKDGTPY
ncbi:MAG TPA: cupin domain-containing protein [Afifellaceae bacterium]|nr:cupin domain-containing protein [Afifellaceae bacterium]